METADLKKSEVRSEKLQESGSYRMQSRRAAANKKPRLNSTIENPVQAGLVQRAYEWPTQVRCSNLGSGGRLWGIAAPVTKERDPTILCPRKKSFV